MFFLFFTFSFVHSQYSKNIKENYNRSKLIEDKKTLSENFIESMRNVFNKLLLLNSASKLNSLKNAIKQCNTLDYEMLHNGFVFINSKMEKVELIAKYRKEYDINAGLLSIKEAEVERSEKELEKLKEELADVFAFAFLILQFFHNNLFSQILYI